MDITSLTALTIGKMIRQKEITSVDATKAVLQSIKEKEPLYNSYITVIEEDAIKRSALVQERIEKGEFAHSPLAGVPMAIKYNICTKGIKTTCASKILYNFEPTYNATAVDKLIHGGAVILGKLNMDEFAMGCTTETSFFGATKNPRNTEHVPGGSSGGSAAAVAADEAFYTLGSDTGGSIRQPSAYCGVTGIKPTYGRVSRYGLIAFASSLDQIGPIGKDVSDCAAALTLLSGYDPLDSTSIKKETCNYMNSLVDDVKGMRIGIPKGYLAEGIDEEVKEAIMEAGKELEAAGAKVEYFDLETIHYAVPAYYVIASAEASSNLSGYDGVKYGYRTEEFNNLSDLYKNTRSEGFGAEVKRRMMIGSFVLSSGYYDAYYNKALKVRRVITDSFLQAFENYDVILGPTTPSTAPKLMTSLSDPLKMYLGDIYTVSVNLAGLPAISLPCGTDKKGLPIGLQLIGKHFGEEEIIRAAYTFEQRRKEA